MKLSESKVLQINFKVDTKESLNSTEFFYLFKIVNEMAYSVAEHEAWNILASFNIENEKKYQIMNEFQRRKRYFESPAEIKEIKRGSWVVVVTIGAPFVYFIFKDIIGSTIKEAWDESNYRQRLKEYFLNSAFGGAFNKIREKAISIPQGTNLAAKNVEYIAPEESKTPALEITFERREIITVKVSGEEEIDEFFKNIEERKKGYRR